MLSFSDVHPVYTFVCVCLYMCVCVFNRKDYITNTYSICTLNLYDMCTTTHTNKSMHTRTLNIYIQIFIYSAYSSYENSQACPGILERPRTALGNSYKNNLLVRNRFYCTQTYTIYIYTSYIYIYYILCLFIVAVL